MKLPTREQIAARTEERRQERERLGLSEELPAFVTGGGIEWCGPGAEALRAELIASGRLAQA